MNLLFFHLRDEINNIFIYATWSYDSTCDEQKMNEDYFKNNEMSKRDLEGRKKWDKNINL